MPSGLVRQARHWFVVGSQIGAMPEQWSVQSVHSTQEPPAQADEGCADPGPEAETKTGATPLTDR